MARVFTPKGEMTRVFTLHSMGYLHRMKSTGVFTLKGEMPKVFTPRCEMARVFTLDSTGVKTKIHGGYSQWFSDAKIGR